MPHKFFIESYTKAKISVEDALIAKRQAAVDAVAVSCDIPTVIALTRVYLQLDPTDGAAKQTRATFQKADKTFPPRDHDQELRIMAGETLAHMFDVGPKEIASIGALALEVNGKQSREPVAHLRDEAKAFLAREGDAVRDFAAFQLTSVPAIDAAKIKKLAAIADVATIAKEAPAISQAFTTLGAQLDALAKQNSVLLRNQRLLSEEASIAWWLLAKRLGVHPAAELAMTRPAAAFILAAWDLAHTTQLLPPSPASGAILNAMLTSSGVTDQELTEAEVVAQLPEDFAQSVKRLATDNVGLSLCPFLRAISETAKAGNKKHSGMSLAKQAFDEFVLLRAVIAGGSLGK